MRQHTPPEGTLFLVCTKCDRAEWRRVGSTDENPDLPACPHCGGRTIQRFPLTLALTEADRGLLKFIANATRTSTQDSAARAIAREVHHVAGERAKRGKPIPQWIAEWLQTNKEKI
jgi:DNA-directed RNA polymerase subunit RPC12/RpoP